MQRLGAQQELLRRRGATGDARSGHGTGSTPGGWRPGRGLPAAPACSAACCCRSCGRNLRCCWSLRGSWPEPFERSWGDLCGAQLLKLELSSAATAPLVAVGGVGAWHDSISDRHLQIYDCDIFIRAVLLFPLLSPSLGLALAAAGRCVTTSGGTGSPHGATGALPLGVKLWSRVSAPRNRRPRSCQACGQASSGSSPPELPRHLARVCAPASAGQKRH